ncbi:putative 2-dehydropantoate 2-reductase [Lysinibacillus sp. PLM2]|nr:putative 2-dehydropantoate 2-reductase [Lysinibacillus sp. PLM2]
MEVVVIGAGAVGMLVASFLNDKHQVTLVVRREEQANQINQKGLTRININETASKTNPIATTRLQVPEKAVVLVALKYGQLHKVYPFLKEMNPGTPILFLQNGLAHYEEALHLPQRHLAFSSCQFGAQKENDTTVVHRGIGILKLAVERGSKETFELFKDINQELFPVEYVKNAEQMLFEKALLNSFINPLTAILNVKNGFLVENVNTLQLLEQMYEELKSAFPLEMDKFTFEEVKNLSKKTAQNTSSMLADISNARLTEVDTIVGAIIKKASMKGHQLPILKTLYSLVKALEERSEKM